MATVYLAHDVRHDRMVAIKVLRPDLAATLGGERFLREIRIAAKLTHPHIMPLHDSGEADGLLFYVMPYIEGESLRDQLTREGELPIAEAVSLLRDVVDALASAHKQGIVHRDIKPDNVLLSEGHALVTDFGVAKAVSAARDESSLTSFGVAVGTPAYMSPEQAAGDTNIDHRADLYAVGALAYEMLTARPPFDGESAQSVLAAHVSEAPRPVTDLRDAVPPQLASVVMRCLEKRPADRFQSAYDLRSALDALATPSGAITPADAWRTTGIEQALEGSDPKRVMGLYAVMALVVVLVCYALMVLLGLPSWALTGAIVLVGFGLPVALLTGRAERRRAASQAGTTTATPANRMERWLSWRRVVASGGVMFGLYGGLVAVYMALRLLGIGPVGTLVASGVLKERDRIVLSVFDNRTTDSTLGETVTQLFRIDLAQSPTVTVLEPVQIERVLARMQRDPDAPLTTELAREVAQREGLKAMVSGEILSVGTGFVVSSSLSAVATDEVMWAGRETASDASGIIEAVDRLSASLRAKVGESLRTIRADAPLAQVTTRSTEALRKYAQADKANNEADYERAISLLEDAIADDSTFAMAHRKLAVILTNQNQDPERADSAFNTAYELRDRLTERERYLAEAAYHTYVTDDEQAAVTAYRTLLDKYPTDRIALNNLAVAYAGAGRRADAADLYMRSIEQGGAPAVTFTNAIPSLYEIGQQDSAAATLDRFEQEYPGQPQALRLRAALASAGFDYVAAEEHILALRSRQPGNPIVQAMAVGELASLELIRGRTARAMEHLLELLQVQEQAGMTFIDQPRSVFDALTTALLELRFLDNRAAAIATLDGPMRDPAWLALEPEDRDYLSFAVLYAEAGRPDQARELTGRFEAEVPQDSRDDVGPRADLHQARAAIALAEGRAADAVTEYLASRELRPACTLCELPEIASAYDVAGQPDSAIATLERYLETPFLSRAGIDNVNLWAVFIRLGELYEERGNRDRAIEYYNRFVDLWQDAEPQLQPRVSEIRNRLARLVGETG
jgi:tetratricopeptide (TPR) repeat protein